MRILQINTHDIQGGAARAAYRLHQGLRQIGADCRMLVRHKVSLEDSVLQVQKSELESPIEDIDETAIQTHYIDTHRTELSNTYFSHSFPGFELANSAVVRAADVINLHWVARFQSPVTLGSLVHSGKSVVWTLHDQWPFTGGCHYSAGCQNYRQDCRSCPQLTEDPFSLPSAVLNDKRQLFKHANLTIVTPSRWLAECAHESSVLKNFRVEVYQMA
jgi:hypothetical protein